MYDEAACVEVLVRPHDSDTAYREYRAPRPSICSGRENERYIEAVNDERFEVVAAHLTIKEEELEALNRGRIEVTVQVGRRKRIGGIYNSGNSYALPGKTSTKVAIDEGKSHGVASVSTAMTPASKKIKTEAIESVNSIRTASKPPATPTVKSSKDKMRARIESQLEDIRLQMEGNRLKRQMMDLEDAE
ncbi:hypothetical protein D0868_08446 [Hortaea werneckii]|uniref:Uncharacterized protein n=1 Tax=Hortaea werneckii TaxID=91943 RepID=A0A3M6YFA1_HORWE|nr:hypothetical protein D0868_08446 [Hortaea werneckii]